MAQRVSKNLQRTNIIGCIRQREPNFGGVETSRLYFRFFFFYLKSNEKFSLNSDFYNEVCSGCERNVKPTGC